MKTLNVELSEEDCVKYGLESESISFELFMEKIRDVIAREALDQCHQIAQEAGINKLSIDDINEEIKAVRNAKNNT